MATTTANKHTTHAADSKHTTGTTHAPAGKDAGHASSAHTKHIDDTIETINDHVKKESTTAITSISSWMKTLESHEEFAGISKDLGALKEALHAKDGAQIASLMEKLGAATTAAAEKADGGHAGVKALGKALTAAAKAIAKLS